MFKKMKLGTKILSGFGMLILIACLLGGIAVWNMKTVQSVATILVTENVPAVAVANNVERYSLETMFEVRGYAYTEDPKFLAEGMKHLEQVKKYLKDARAHGASSPNLAKLAEAAQKAEAAALVYEQLLAQGVTLTQALEAERKSAEAAAAKYMEICNAFLKDQQTKTTQELKEGKDAAAIEERLKKIDIVGDIIDLGNAIVIGTWKSQFQRNPALFTETKKLFEKVHAKLDELKAITRQEIDLKRIDECRQTAKAYEGNMATFLTKWLEREEVTAKRGKTGDEVVQLAKATAQLSMTDTEKASQEAAQSLASASTVMIVGLAAAMVVGIALAIFITRSITGPVRRIIDGLNEGAQEVASAAGQVSGASQSLAEGSSEQAASIEETSSSLEEMSSMTKRNADNAQQANSLMSEAKQVVATANGSMSRLTESMAEITRASEETSKIIKTIDEIAFQTNLLALNAAVEAARAGEAGAGFAVVADEVRNLAMRAADAAKNTANLIEGTVKKVKDGSELVSRTNEAFQQVAGSSAKAADLVAEISAASNEQAQGIGQVNTAVIELDKVTQQNAANAEESASAAEEMSAQAETMKGMVADLVAIVGSAGKGHEEARADGQMAGGRLHTAVASAKKKAASKAGSGRKSAKPAAEAIIPLDQSEELSNF
jgi:methyl-accepting chemotaxis protein